MAGKKSEGAIITLKPSHLKIALRHNAMKLIPTFIWGGPGLGKSAIARQVAEEMGYNFVDIRLSQMEPTDLRGIPYPAQENGQNVVLWSPPHFYQRDPKVKTLYFFDEMNAAPQSIQAAAYQIVLDRQIGDYKLGPEDVVMAAGNRETDRGSTFKMPTPLMNRLDHLEIRPDFEDWQTHAIGVNFHRMVVGYVTWQKQVLYNFDPTVASRGFATPRSWEMVSKIETGDTDLPDEVRQALISGAVGEGQAVEYMAYRRLNQKLPNPSDILKGKLKELRADQKETSISYALTIGLCYELRDAFNNASTGANQTKDMEEWTIMADNFFRFMMDNMQPEMTILGARTILWNFKLKVQPKKMASWVDFTKRYNNLILVN